MAREYGQFERGGEARKLLHDRLQREEMGDEAYEKMTAHADNRAFKVFGIAAILLMGAAVLLVTAMGW